MANDLRIVVPTGPFLVVKGASCTVASRCLFRDLDFTVGSGELVEIRGANGSGKSTLLRGLAGLHELDAELLERRAAFEYVGHRTGLAERLTPVENIRWLSRLRGSKDAPQAIEAAMVRFGLAAVADELCATLSAGQQRRAALARLVASDATLWLLDEPLNALDQAGADIVRQLVAEHLAAGGAVVCATHQSVAPPAHVSREIVLGR